MCVQVVLTHTHTPSILPSVTQSNRLTGETTMKTFLGFLTATALVVSALTTAAAMPALVIGVACGILFLTVK